MSTTKPLLLHGHGSGPNPFKAAIILEVLSVPYEVKLWDFGDDPQKGVKGATFLKINENGRVPALEDPNTGVISWESGAVVNYLLRVYDNENKLGPKASEQDHVDFDKWIFFLVSSLGPMMGQVNWFRHYHPQKNDDALRRYEEQAYRTLDVFEGQLKKTGGGSILPQGFSAVDAHFYPWIYQYTYAGLSLDKCPTIQAWLKKLSGMEEIKAAYEKISKGQT